MKLKLNQTIAPPLCHLLGFAYCRYSGFEVGESSGWEGKAIFFFFPVRTPRIDLCPEFPFSGLQIRTLNPETLQQHLTCADPLVQHGQPPPLRAHEAKFPQPHQRTYLSPGHRERVGGAQPHHVPGHGAAPLRGVHHQHWQSQHLG